MKTIIKISNPLSLSLFFGWAILAACYIRLIQEGFSGYELHLSMASLYLIGAPYLAIISGLVLYSPTAEQYSQRAILIIPIYYSFAYLVYGLGTESITVDGLLRISLYASVPCIIASTIKNPEQKATWQDLAILLCIWIPVDEAVIQKAWPWPNGVAKHIYTIPIGVTILGLLIASVRRLEGLEFKWNLPWKSYLEAFVYLSIFLAIAIPIGLATDFIAYKPKENLGIDTVIFSFVYTFLVVAVPEEILFRGFLQNLLAKTWARPLAALIVASVIFGISHFNNGPSPDWRYIFIASIAGVFYGLAYMRTKSLIPAIFVHTCVDVIWINFFYK